MHRLEKIIIRGFRGQSRVIELDLKPDANFLIGRNGTGKTTLINLVHAALSVDVAALKAATFDRIDVIFKQPKNRVKPRFAVIRTIADDGTPKICYRVADSATADPDEYNFNRVRRKVSTGTLISLSGETASPSKLPLKERLGAIFQTTWLSLQRGADKLSSDENDWDVDERPGIDRKLDNLSNELTRYFSRLDRQVSDQTQLFQKEWFLSFLANDRKIKESDINRIDDDKEREALTSIFSDFAMEPSTYSVQLDRHFRLARRAKAAFKQDSSTLVRDYLVATDVLRLHTLVEQWQELERLKDQIYAPKHTFQQVASDMLYRKILVTNSSNQIVVLSAGSFTENDKVTRIPLDQLSSGEKQLIIFLAETLLQEQKSYVFLADEPELSLHVEWQEELVPALLKINPNAQVLFATHSPDVVSTYQQNVFAMEEIAG